MMNLTKISTRIPVLCVLAALVLPLVADDIIVREIGGVPVIKTRLTCGDKKIDVNVIFDMGASQAMIIHEKSVGGLDMTPEQADGKEVDLTFDGGVRWTGVKMRTGAVELLEKFTATYAKELKDIPVVAIIGLPAVSSGAVELDLRRGILRTMGMTPDGLSNQEIDYEMKPVGMVLRATGANGNPFDVLLATHREESLMSPALLKDVRRAGAKPNVLKLGGIDFAEHAAFRFRPLEDLGASAVQAILGNGALRDFTVTASPQRRKISFVPQADPVAPTLEQDYYFALADQDAGKVAAFITQAKGSRLVDDACIQLLQIRLADPKVTPQALDETLVTLAGNYDPIRSSSVLYTIADELQAGKRPDRQTLATRCLELAMAQSSNALDQNTAHQVHLRLGKNALLAGDLIMARRHLMSAAFGLPKDGECNFWLGELYQKINKPQRAWSRYVQALVAKNASTPIKATCLKRIDELNRDPKLRETFDMRIAEEYLAGRLTDAEFHAPTRYTMEQQGLPVPVKLVEFFADAKAPATGGMQLAFQALDEYFDGSVALIAYHIGDPMHSEVAAQRLAYYGGKVPLAAFDGNASISNSASQAEILTRNAEVNFTAFRDACLPKVTPPAAAWTLAAKMQRDGIKVTGSLTVTSDAPTDGLKFHAILCERSVMATEANGVFFHHFVARRALTPPEGIDLQRATAAPTDFAVNAEEMSRDLTRMLDDPKRPASRSKPNYVDPGQLLVVTFVQNEKTRQVLAAETFQLSPENDPP